MDIYSILFVLFFVSISGFVIFVFLSKKGKNFFIQMTLGPVVKDYGEMGQPTTIRGGLIQKLRLIECTDGKENFFVLESKILTQITYTKISKDAAQNLVKVFSST